MVMGEGGACFPKKVVNSGLSAQGRWGGGARTNIIYADPALIGLKFTANPRKFFFALVCSNANPGIAKL